jgi:hypothetical protein
LSVQFSLVGINLPLLIGLLHFLTLKLIADQCTGAQPQSAPDRRADAWTTHRRSNRPTRGGTSQGTDPRAFLSRR